MNVNYPIKWPFVVTSIKREEGVSDNEAEYFENTEKRYNVKYKDKSSDILSITHEISISTVLQVNRVLSVRFDLAPEHRISGLSSAS
jgi:hypothetical protein